MNGAVCGIRDGISPNSEAGRDTLEISIELLAALDQFGFVVVCAFEFCDASAEGFDETVQLFFKRLKRGFVRHAAASVRRKSGSVNSAFIIAQGLGQKLKR